jgi:NADPH-dependent glutamate synthase beta subunit-like oxidoreductase
MKKANLGQPLEVGTDVVVIGGGYTAMDCSRTSLRHGRPGLDVYRRTCSELVVTRRSSARRNASVRMEFLATIEVLGKKGKVTGVKFIRNRPASRTPRAAAPLRDRGSEFVIPARRSSGRPQPPT